MTTSLTISEKDALTAYETIIREGLETFYQVGNALLVIRDARLYRETHGTFESYVAGRWGMSDRHARRLIDASVVVTEMQELTGPMGPVPTSERQARELVGLDARSAVEVLSAAAENGSVPATAERIRDTRLRYQRPPVQSDRPRGPVKRRPLTDDMRVVNVDAVKLSRKLRRLLDDDRLNRNAAYLSGGRGSELRQLADNLAELLGRVTPS